MEVGGHLIQVVVKAGFTVPIDAILPEICVFIVGFSCTVWTKTRSLRTH